MREKYTTHVNWMKCLSGGEVALAAAVPAGSGGGGGPAATRLKELMESVEGGREVIDVPTRFVLFHCDLVEMDIADNSALHRVHGYICNDSLIVATWLRDRRGPVRYKLSSVYPISTIAVVNVRDLAGVKNAWKLLVSPDARLFQVS